jgi:hypothetical protein
MNNRSLGLSLLAGLVLLAAAASPGHAQQTRSWVSGVGDDSNPCTRTAPCKTFAGAIAKTAAAGEINCLDSGGFGQLTITKAISIICEGVTGNVLGLGVNAFRVIAGAADVVVLKGLDIQGAGSGLNGILFISGAALHVQNTTIQGFGGSGGNGIMFAPSGVSQLFVQNTTIMNNNKAMTSAAILVQPTGSGTGSGIIDGVKLLNSGNGLVVDGNGSGGGQMVITFRNSAASGNTNHGVRATTALGRAAARVVVDRSAVTNNNAGIVSTGQGADVTVGYSVITGNNTGLAFSAPGDIRSYVTNQLRGNIGTNGSPSSTIALE